MRVARVLGGWASWTFDVDGALIARFPRSPSIAAAARRELALLPVLSKHASFAVPCPSHGGTWGGEPFFVYPRVPGRSLTAADNSPALLRRLGEMLAELHNFPVDTAAACLRVEPSARTWRRHFEDLWDIIEPQVLPLLDPALADEVRSGFL